MQRIVIDQPYQFVPPRYSRFWKAVIRLWLPGYLRRRFGLVAVESVGAGRLREAVDSGHGVVVAANHPRPSDPLALGWAIDRETSGRPFFSMGGWHIFMESGVQRFLLQRMGVFSMYREGVDRKSIHCAIRILVEGGDPLVMFPEGIVSNSNDRLTPLLDGAAFVARMAAKRRQAEGRKGGALVLPAFIRYIFDGDLEQAAGPALGAIEERFSWRRQEHLPLQERVERIAEAVLAQREIEHLGTAASGDHGERVACLIGHLLGSIEEEWGAARNGGDTMARIKRLRGAILAGMIDGSELGEDERQRRWHQLGVLYQVQQLHCYPGDYLQEGAGTGRLLDMIDRLEEDLTDTNTPHPPRRAVVFYGEALAADATARRGANGETLTGRLRESLEGLMRESLA